MRHRIEYLIFEAIVNFYELEVNENQSNTYSTKYMIHKHRSADTSDESAPAPIGGLTKFGSSPSRPDKPWSIHWCEVSFQDLTLLGAEFTSDVNCSRAFSSAADIDS